MAKKKPVQINGGGLAVKFPTNEMSLPTCKKCGQLYKWHRFAEAKWRRANLDNTPHRDSCSAAEAPVESTLATKAQS